MNSKGSIMAVSRRLSIQSLSVMAAAPWIAHAQARASWRVGRVLPLTGAQASYGEAKRDGGDAFANRLNAKGGINGRSLEFITKDDAYVEAKTTELIASVAISDDVIAFSGFFGAPHCVAAAKALADLKLPGVGFTTGSNAFRAKPQREVFPVRASFVQETTAIVRHLKTTGLNGATIAFVNIPFGALARVSFEAAAQAQDYKLNAPVEIKADGSNILDAADRLAQSPLVLMALHTPSAIALVQAIREKKSGTQLWCLSAVDIVVMAGKLKEQARGVSTSLVVPPTAKLSIGLVREYLEATKAINKVPNLYGLEAYAEAKVLAAGLTRMRGNDPAALVSGLESLNKLDLGGLEVSYGNADRTGSRFVDLAIVSENTIRS
jgi:branched-chain amino acid transport system substrate-binding protein